MTEGPIKTICCPNCSYVFTQPQQFILHQSFEPNTDPFNYWQVSNLVIQSFPRWKISYVPEIRCFRVLFQHGTRFFHVENVISAEMIEDCGSPPQDEGGKTYSRKFSADEIAINPSISLIVQNTLRSFADHYFQAKESPLRSHLIRDAILGAMRGREDD